MYRNKSISQLAVDQADKLKNPTWRSNGWTILRVVRMLYPSLEHSLSSLLCSVLMLVMIVGGRVVSSGVISYQSV
ncbi:hypothetical protein QTG54_012235 [Skeletonema marinoi]|uniref:Uncharacterized protein n=1 Tax=Skeletonema marinoi TaxID=267567 RepID=A0AAD9D985_9STRA|nr:hypothetical protein QTG54_012235 [Skeletonema marinoi]